MSPTPNTELNKGQLLGRERTLVRQIESNQNKVDELSKLIEEKQKELDEVQGLIQEEEWISSGKRIYIIRGEVYTKSKVHYRGKYRWFHLGKTDKLNDTSDEDLKELTRQKFYKNLITK